VAELKEIVTSKRFIENLHVDLKPFQDAGIEILFLEDIRAGISAAQKFAAGIFSQSPVGFPKADDSAVILFTSGSEGDPKAVELTHRNVLANIRQMVSVIDLMESDRFFNALPLFHSFGLAIGLLLPLVRSTFVFLYLSPLHYRVVPSAFYNLDCTVLFGTNTFLNGYARKAHPYDFEACVISLPAQKNFKRTQRIFGCASLACVSLKVRRDRVQPMRQRKYANAFQTRFGWPVPAGY